VPGVKFGLHLFGGFGSDKGSKFEVSPSAESTAQITLHCATVHMHEGSLADLAYTLIQHTT
jgi:hypothetical protein